MSARYFADYVREFKRTGALSLDTPALVCHDDGQDVAPQGNADTGMGVEPSRASSPWFEALSSRPSEPNSGPGPSLSDPLKAPRGSRPSLQVSSTPPEQDPLRLVFPISKRAGTSFDHISIGRTSNMDVVLPLLQVSKFHAYFTRDAAGAFTLADAGSKNGTWIGARRLTVRTPEPVHDGDRIRLGMYTFTFLTQAGFVDLVKERALHWVENPARPSQAMVRRSPG
jgi:pSer/pThr/pTyr-binding forkhead associated (FHA) protein